MHTHLRHHLRHHLHRNHLLCALLATILLALLGALAGCGVSTVNLIGADTSDATATSVSTVGVGTIGPGATVVATIGGPTGTITGDVVASPTCPVQQAGNPCVAVVPNREVDIQTQAGTTIASTKTDANGRFSVAVPPGKYVVRVKIVQGQVGLRQVTPGDVTVIANQTTTVHIDLDTGIR